LPSNSQGELAPLTKQWRMQACSMRSSRRRDIRRTAAVHPIGDLQIEYSLISRGIEDKILSTCRELGIVSPPVVFCRVG